MRTDGGVPIRDTILWVEDTGEADLPPIVCLHSLFIDGSMFDGLVAAAARQFRIVRPDFRGQGSSAPSTAPIVDMATCADDMIALIETMRLPPVHLIAASMGGDVAVRMIARRPALFRSLILTGSSARAEPPAQKADMAVWFARTERAGIVGDDIPRLMAIMFGQTTRDDDANAAMLDHWRTKMRALPRSTWRAIAGVIDRSDALELLPDIRIPALIFSGTEDIGRPIEWSRELAEGIAGSEWIVLDGVGHTPLLEAPDRVIPEMLRFLHGVA